MKLCNYIKSFESFGIKDLEIDAVISVIVIIFFIVIAGR